jgi:putative DNA primase/helicase
MPTDDGQEQVFLEKLHWAQNAKAAAAVLETEGPAHDGEPGPEGEMPSLKDALLDYPSMITLKLPPRKMLFPFLHENSIAMIFGPRGVGKTFFQLSLAASLVTGSPFFRWAAPRPTGLLYVDGEMDLDELRERMAALLPEQPIAPLFFLTSQYVFQKIERDLVLTSPEVRQEITKLLDDNPDIRVLVLDNISCLFSGINEDKKQDWEPINAWLIRLRHRGITTLLVHHAGKQGQQRGTSGREDSLDTVIQLNRPADYSQKEGCHFEIHFSKCRSAKGDELEPLDARIIEKDGRLEWAWKSLELSKEEQAKKLFEEGVTTTGELCDELGITKGYASKLLRRIKNEGKN